VEEKRGYLLETGRKGLVRFARESWNCPSYEFAKSIGYQTKELEGLYWTVGDEKKYKPARRKAVTVAIIVHDRLFPELTPVDVDKLGKHYIGVEEFDKLC
jgi:hypothetical protein